MFISAHINDPDSHETFEKTLKSLSRFPINNLSITKKFINPDNHFRYIRSRT